MRGLKTASEIHKLALELGLCKQLLLINKAGRALPISESGYELPEQIMAAVAQRKKILFLLSEKEYKKPTDKWVNYLLDAQKLDSNYYYSITTDHITDSIDWSQVVSYSSYLAER